MRLVENLRKAEEKSVMTIRRGMERAREEWADVERRIRQRMRIYPQKQRAMATAYQPDKSTWNRMCLILHRNPASRAHLSSQSMDRT